jgi:hypothetical protein
MEPNKKQRDRRAKQRFRIEREMRYKLLEDGEIIATGSGNTVDIGSSGVAFVAEETLSPGAFVELSISWPALLDESCPMRLIVFGRVVRATGRKGACTVDKYEFRTQARAFQRTLTRRHDSMLQRWVDGLRKETMKALVS